MAHRWLESPPASLLFSDYFFLRNRLWLGVAWLGALRCTPLCALLNPRFHHSDFLWCQRWQRSHWHRWLFQPGDAPVQAAGLGISRNDSWPALAALQNRLARAQIQAGHLHCCAVTLCALLFQDDENFLLCRSRLLGVRMR